LHSTSKAYGESKVKEIDGQIAADDMMTSSTTSEEGKVNLYAYNATGLEQLLVSWGQPKFRSKQVWDWLHVRGTTDFDLMQDLPKDLRAKLKQVATLGTLKLAVQQVSKDGTIKRAYQLHDGQMIESVLMPYNDGRRTACISSQAGCAMGCVFCATGQMGFARQLTSSEILEQVQRFHVELLAKGERLSNVVLMGMGEPLVSPSFCLGSKVGSKVHKPQSAEVRHASPMPLISYQAYWMY
jgi:23S rRNA (adenine2503-C2)-methyltransferase